MVDAQLYSNIIRQMSEISDRIQELLSELQPITNQIPIGGRDRAILEKNSRLQADISRLDELRERLQELFPG